MFGIAATRNGRFERRTARRLSTWTRDYLREVALADLGCAVLGVFVAAQIRFGNNVTSTYLALSLALPVLWIAALWLAGAYDVRFIGTGSDEYRLFDRCAAAAALDNNDSDGVLFKLQKDPRVTAVGAHLQRWSVDELPQLFNVFLGHMSLVGPRPALPDEAEKYADHVHRRLVVKPGLTGLWQVNGRKTISVMLSGSGAY